MPAEERGPSPEVLGFNVGEAAQQTACANHCGSLSSRYRATARPLTESTGLLSRNTSR
jgi:hypothetical protein